MLIEQGAPLADAAPDDRRRLDRRARASSELTRAPAAGRAGSPAPATRCTCGRSTPQSDLELCLEPRRQGRDHRPAGVPARAARRSATTPPDRFTGMAKKSRTKSRPAAPPPGEVGPRQPCPCGSGKRYKACHGAAGRRRRGVRRPARSRGCRRECDVVALRELVPAATAPLTLKRRRPRRSRSARCCRWPRRRWSATTARSGSGCRCSTTSATRRATSAPCSRRALATEEPGIVGLTDPPGEGPRLQDLITDDALDVTVHDGFDFWIADVEDADGRDGGRAGAGQRRGARRPPG